MKVVVIETSVGWIKFMEKQKQISWIKIFMKNKKIINLGKVFNGAVKKMSIYFKKKKYFFYI